jgi:hypothetical protein
MNRDQWHRKMRREIEMFSYTGSTTEDSAKLAVSGKRAGGEGPRVATADQKRASGSRPAEAKEPELVISLAEKYGACCEWDLSIKTKKL